MTKIKICGITNEKDARNAAEAGADALGFIFSDSPRQISPEKAAEIIQALPPYLCTVGVFVNEKREKILKIAKKCRLQAVQLHGEETDADCAFLRKYLKVIKAIRIKDDKSPVKALQYSHADALLFDSYSPESYGGTGKVFAHKLLKQISWDVPIIIAGGMNAGNVQRVIRMLAPYAIDLSSAVEKKPGIKDIKLIRQFMKAVHG